MTMNVVYLSVSEHEGKLVAIPTKTGEFTSAENEIVEFMRQMHGTNSDGAIIVPPCLENHVDPGDSVALHDAIAAYADQFETIGKATNRYLQEIMGQQLSAISDAMQSNMLGDHQ